MMRSRFGPKIEDILHLYLQEIILRGISKSVTIFVKAHCIYFSWLLRILLLW